jgi:hypothetical protein
MPTKFIRRSGAALIGSGVLWPAGIVIIYGSEVADRTRPWEGLPMTVFLVGALVLVLAGALLAVGIVGLNRRHDGALGVAGQAAFWIAVVTAVTAFGAWAWGVWVTALGIGAVVLSAALIRAAVSPRMASILVGAGGAFTVVAVWVTQLTTDEVSLGEGAFTGVLLVGLVIYSIGLIWLGIWLRTEELVMDSTADTTE